MDIPARSASVSCPPSTGDVESRRMTLSDSIPASLRDSSVSAINPFSPPPSVHSFSSPVHTPLHTPGLAFSTSSDAGYFQDAGSAVPNLRGPATPVRETFTSPPSRPLTMLSTSAHPLARPVGPRTKSTLLTDAVTIEKPWLEKREPLSLVAYFITYGIAFIGIAIGAIRCYLDWTHVAVMTGSLCPVLDESFDGGDAGVLGDNSVFFREVDMSGFGNGQFEMTTSSSKNSFVRDGHLYIMPTLTSEEIGESAVMDNYVYNLTDCTFNITHGDSYTSSVGPGEESTGMQAADFDIDGYYKACSGVSNSSAGQVISPVQSARLSTRSSAKIRYGKVEVKAKLPTGDWLWTAIWMLPVDSSYGPWPLSGEIDIMESRGNGPRYPFQGTNYVRGSLNWGPLTWLSSVYKTYGWWTRRLGTYDQEFHTYSLEWTEDFIRIYVDTRLHHMLELKVDEPFWDRGDYPAVVQNGSDAIVLDNPWVNGSRAAPFDQEFYLILDVAVGGTNGWFPDDDGKPWLDGSAAAMRDFIKSKDKWYSSWPDNAEERAFVIDSVKMWQQC
ncbi:glycoside hydrolase family 16 protein [Schizophyllum amplum]|uniref:Glycoside hydrolase family 16 protein n=1 Tax=Schizophyllum amplum TaxID=97359 RepID=A0A550CNZ5_9AGAR|nr:glycoside hydrolase family 16 protein [Auriculariopsis ampla]